MSAGEPGPRAQSAIRIEEGTFDATDGRRLFERRWLPGAEARADVIIVHGYAEHSGRYAHVGEHFASHGYAVHAFDLRGHGRSDGPRALVRSFAAYLADMRLFLARVRDGSNARPAFLLGHSMGGTIAALSAVGGAPAVDGLILSGAGLTLDRTPAALRWVVLVLGRLLPRLPLSKLNASDVSRDPEIVRSYEADPLVYRGRMRAGLVAAMIRAVARIQSGMARVSPPLLIMHGTADALADPAGSRQLYERAASTDKTLRLYDGLYHEILNEPERDQVLADIRQWLDGRTRHR